MLKFKSGYESPVEVYYVNPNTDRLRYSDVVGFSWSELNHIFNYVALDAVSKGYVETRIATEKAHSGSRSLYQSQIITAGGAQNRLQFYSDDAEFPNGIFTRRWLYYEDISSVLNKLYDGLSIAGTRELADTRSIFPIIYHDGAQLYWQLTCLDYTRGTKYSEWLLWFVTNKAYPIPVGRWFKLDVYVYRHVTDGVAKVWIDDDLILNKEGVATKSGVDPTWITKLSDIDIVQGTPPFYHWVDDIEIWDGLPTVGPTHVLNISSKDILGNPITGIPFDIKKVI